MAEAEPMDQPGAPNREVQEIWDRNAEFWDAYMGEGGQFQRLLLGPATERLLALQPGEEVLEIACGNGMFARRMAQLGARVVATDFSRVFLERARARTTENADRIEYALVDATAEDKLLALGAGRFSAAVSIMALMDMASIDPLFAALSRLLRPGGRFVFSVMHPCFNSPGVARLAERGERDGRLHTIYALKVTGYTTLVATKGLGIATQPVPQYYFPRTLSVLLGAGLAAGFVVDGMEEPVFDLPDEPDRLFDWANYREFPPALVVRMRLPA
jgi:2-polyprenyl-3-methyl-5-hydroxy-6-metoxy-1,4-benzoquinol methylase